METAAGATTAARQDMGLLHGNGESHQTSGIVMLVALESRKTAPVTASAAVDLTSH